MTNAAHTTTSYGYDAMGRLAAITPPGDSGINYNPTSIAFTQVSGDEYGLGANHWRQTITTGNAVTANYFDGLWRKRVTATYDAANPNGTQRMQLLQYDPDGRSSFTSYPVRSLGSITDALPGTSSTYEALGRPTGTVASSELGNLPTSIQYLAGFQKRVTNPRNYVTTTSYQAFDQPSESALTAIAAPEGVSVNISRDVFGKPLSITRSGNYGGTVSATRSYVYDANQLLCKTVEPEVGATIQKYDAANNLSWKASGLALTALNNCNQGDVP